MSDPNPHDWSYLQILGRRVSMFDDSPWRCVRRYGGDFSREQALADLKAYRSGELCSLAFRHTPPEQMEFRLELVTMHQWIETQEITA